ncbi:TrkH family potassium uptake protein [Halovivax cerinus]|uniref:TrkH family potassium uptake protein n=1 Tax=Halovivax cerinus TaxID=1487865 RepID=A0ABD5NMC6_9EURY|nr:TrkH family potassium uptake protein [Halovivax cerinus]
MALRVDWRSSASQTGTVLKWLSVPLAAPLLLALLDGRAIVPFAVAIAVTLALGTGMERLSSVRNLGHREALLVVASAWFGVALVGAIPFVLVGQSAPPESAFAGFPVAVGGGVSFTGEFGGVVNSLFESMSGLTTTGATIMSAWDFANQSRAILLWRQLLQWLGGLGILIVAIGLFANLRVGGAQLMETETQTQSVNKLTPEIEQTARIIWGLYVGLTIVTIAVLYGLHVVGIAPEMTLFNAVAHALTSVSTAGFSPEAQSIGAFEPIVQWVLIPVMLVGATNFILLWYVVQGDLERLLRSEEFRFYLGIVTVAASIVIGVLVVDPGHIQSVEASVRHGLFNVVSMITTTGYASYDYTTWGPGAQHVLFLSMFVGGMAGSTTCSIKTLRWLVILKGLYRNLFLSIHPTAVRPIRLGDSVVDEETIGDIFSYVMLALLIFFGLTVLVVVDASLSGRAVSEFDALGAAASIALNIGPAFGEAGPMDNYAVFPTSTRFVMVVMMWIGRIEFIPVLVLLLPAFWKS